MTAGISPETSSEAEGAEDWRERRDDVTVRLITVTPDVATWMEHG